MPTETTVSQLQSDDSSNESAPSQDNVVAQKDRLNLLAFAATGVIVAFVGAFVVLSIPFAILSAPLPSSVDRLGLTVEATQSLFFGRAWYLLPPSALFAIWAGYKCYRWGQNAPIE